MVVLGLDPSLTDQGWCVIDYSKPKDQRLIASGRIRTKAKDFFTRRYRLHYVSVRDLIDMYQPDYVGLEKPPPQATWSAGLYPIWIGISDICTEARIPFATWMPTSIKALAKELLNETATKLFKSDMVDAAKTLITYKGNLNHNIADAILVNHISYRFRSLCLNDIKEDELTTKERFMFTRTKFSKKKNITENLGMIFKEGDMYYNLLDSKYDYLYDK